MYNDYGIASDFIIFQKANRVNSPSREFINAGGESCVIGYSKFDYFKRLNQLEKTITDRLKGNQYLAVFISQVALRVDINNIRKYTAAPILMDFHGAPNDVYGSVKKSSVISYTFRRLLTVYYFRCLRYYFRNVDGCLVVSNGLEKYFREKFKPKQAFKFFRVPCSLSTELSTEDYNVYRKEYRKEFNVDENDIVFVYSGGIEPWQCVEETVLMYKRITEALPMHTRLCIFSYEVDKARQVVGNDDTCILKSYKSDELEKALCACDYAFLLRKDITTNHVAFPNKFLEYIKSYLRVIATPYVYDVAEQIEKDNLGVITELKDYDIVTKYIRDFNLTKYGSGLVSTVIKRNSFKETLRNVVAFINK